MGSMGLFEGQISLFSMGQTGLFDGGVDWLIYDRVIGLFEGGLDWAYSVWGR